MLTHVVGETWNFFFFFYNPLYIYSPSGYTARLLENVTPIEIIRDLVSFEMECRTCYYYYALNISWEKRDKKEGGGGGKKEKRKKKEKEKGEWKIIRR